MAELTTTSPDTRRLIFISHATPQDNVFTTWLGAHLASAGYEVWSDVTKLIGGEIHWDNIEFAVRDHAIKMVSVLSKVAITKRGFKDELSLGVAVERKNSFSDFVIPLRLDDLDYSDFPPEVIRRNAIDFLPGWQQGLALLLRKLDEDDVPRKSQVDTDSLSAWASSFLKAEDGVVEEQEEVISNTVPVITLPKSVFISQIRTGASRVPSCIYPGPVEVRGKLAVSFFRLSGIDSSNYVHVSEMEFGHFLSEGGADRLSCKKSDVRNLVVKILRSAWEAHLKSLGLLQFTFSNGRNGYFRKYSEAAAKYKFIGPTGIVGRRALFGRSEKKKVYWHFAPEIFPSYGDSIDFFFKPRVIFSEDGLTPIEESGRSHRLRRSFCKSWWQDKWRDLMLAYLASLTSGDMLIRVPLSDVAYFEVGITPKLFTSPVTFSDPDRVSPDIIDDIDMCESVTDIEIDDFDDEDLESLEEEVE
ncbi:MAG: toll/interleukin-1 receptor domain-containing protein [Parvibaculum sp.]|nr:toll/interleukin-1 receptor domain-containing protein [Parvibaculum sp.]